MCDSQLVAFEPAERIAGRSLAITRVDGARPVKTPPSFPSEGFTPLQSAVLDAVAARLGASPRQVALAWLLQHSATILLIPGTSSVAHLRENIAATNIKLPADAVDELDRIGAR